MAEDKATAVADIIVAMIRGVAVLVKTIFLLAVLGVIGVFVAEWYLSRVTTQWEYERIKLHSNLEQAKRDRVGSGPLLGEWQIQPGVLALRYEEFAEGTEVYKTIVHDGEEVLGVFMDSREFYHWTFICGLKHRSTFAQMIDRFGLPSQTVPIGDDLTSSLHFYEQYNIRFRTKDGKVMGMGIYDPKRIPGIILGDEGSY